MFQKIRKRKKDHQVGNKARYNTHWKFINEQIVKTLSIPPLGHLSEVKKNWKKKKAIEALQNRKKKEQIRKKKGNTNS